MIEPTYLNQLLEEVQQESANNGGQFSFLGYTKADYATAFDYLKAFLERIPIYQDPYTQDSLTQTRYYHSSRDFRSFRLLPLNNWPETVQEKAEYWSCFTPPFPARTVPTLHHRRKLETFLKCLNNFVAQQQIRNVYQVEGVDTFYAWGGDHMNDDIVFEAKQNLFILHFGVST
jgi:hypothetical protein